MTIPNRTALNDLLGVLYGPVTLAQKLAALKAPDAKLNLAAVADHGLNLSGEAVRFSLLKKPSEMDRLSFRHLAERKGSGGEAHGWFAYHVLSDMDVVSKESDVESTIINAQRGILLYLAHIEQDILAV